MTDTALQVLEKRYLLRDNKGKVINQRIVRRVARAIAAAELYYNPKADVKAIEDEFFKQMYSLEFLPNSPTLMNAGKKLGQLSAVFVPPVGEEAWNRFSTP